MYHFGLIHHPRHRPRSSHRNSCVAYIYVLMSFKKFLKAWHYKIPMEDPRIPLCSLCFVVIFVTQMGHEVHQGPRSTQRIVQ